MEVTKLCLQIEDLRNEMVSTANREGYSSPETVKISQKLDALLNHFHQKHIA